MVVLVDQEDRLTLRQAEENLVMLGALGILRNPD